MPLYILGSTAPKISADTGSGKWCSAPQTAEYLAYKRALQMAMDSHGLDVTIGVDAVSHIRHYMSNTGNDYLLNMPELMAKSAQLRQQFDQELAEAKAFSQTLHGGPHAIISSQLGHGYFRKKHSQNLFYAIGGYSYWGQGKLTIDPSLKAPLDTSWTSNFIFMIVTTGTTVNPSASSVSRSLTNLCRNFTANVMPGNSICSVRLNNASTGSKAPRVPPLRQICSPR